MLKTAKALARSDIGLRINKKIFANVFANWLAKPAIFPIMAFLIPLAVRAIPELIMGPYVVGFDTIAYYVPNTLTWLRSGVGIWNFLAVAPLFYVLLMGVTSIGVPIVVSLKVISPVFLGLLGLTVYFYANKALSWSSKKSLLVVFFATLYFVALRISWDMLRSELALIFLFTTLIFLEKSGSSRKNGLLLSLSMLSVVLAHQLVAVIMLFIIAVTVIRLSFDRKLSVALNVVVGAIPAVALFLGIVYANYVVSPNFSVLRTFPSQESGVKVLFGFSSYPNLVINTLGFLVFCYLPLAPLVALRVKNFRKNIQLNAWVIWIVIALVSVVISPNLFVAGFPYRWILLLTFPLAFFAADAFARLKSKAYKVGFGLILATLSMSFLFLPSSLALPYFNIYPSYGPTSMTQNTVPLSDCQDTLNALQWTKNNADNGSRLLVHDAFYGWATLTFDSSQLFPYGYGNPALYAQNLVTNGSRYSLYLIWWVNGSGWHGQPTVSSGFNEVYQSGRIAVYAYNSNATANVSSSLGA